MTIQEMFETATNLDYLRDHVDLMERQLAAIHVLTTDDKELMDSSEARALTTELFGADIEDVDDWVIVVKRRQLLSQISWTNGRLEASQANAAK